MRTARAIVALVPFMLLAGQTACVKEPVAVERPPAPCASEVGQPDALDLPVEEPVDHRGGAARVDPCAELVRGATLALEPTDDGADLVVTPDPGARIYEAAERLRTGEPASIGRCAPAELAQLDGVRLELEREGRAVRLRFTSSDERRVDAIRRDLGRFVAEHTQAPMPNQDEAPKEP